MFKEKYRVLAVDDFSLTLRGVESGRVVTIKNADSSTPLKKDDYPVGKLIELSDPSASPKN